MLADNQMGYESDDWRFKWFLCSRGIVKRFVIQNAFLFCADGIYDLSREQYEEVAASFGVGCVSKEKCSDTQVKLLKRGGYYLLVLAGERGDDVCVLDGRFLRRVDHDISYLYERMNEYAVAIVDAFAPSLAILDELALEFKRMGGEGEIDGMTVEYDFYHAVLFDPLTYGICFRKVTGLSSSRTFDDPLTFFTSMGLGAKYRSLSSKGKLPALETMQGSRVAANIQTAAVQRRVISIFYESSSRGSGFSKERVQMLRLLSRGLISLWEDGVFEDVD